MENESNNSHESAEKTVLAMEANEGRLTDFRLMDELIEMKRRCRGLEAAISFIAEDGDAIESGALQLAIDIANQMEALTEKFDAELALRMAEEKST